MLGDLEPAWTEGLAEVELPKLGVRGNHDAPDALGSLGVEDLHLRHVELGGLSFCGFGGSPRYSGQGGNEWTEEEAERAAGGAAGRGRAARPLAPRGRERRARRHTLPALPVGRLGPTRVVYVRGAVPIELS